MAGSSSMASTRRTASLLQCAATLERPARAAERAPERSQIADRQPRRRSGRVIVAVDTAVVRAAARRGKRPPYHGLSGAGGLAPGSVAAKAPNRRPVRHRWRRYRLVEYGEIPGAIDHLTADNR